ncbi:MAG: STAS-like domain-containing protein [Nitrosomonas sp.]|nr:STAS-like domain-containing protein [Nitrosomonas sp.]MDP1951180.1 STAS-like domain-containing protein [Nitrosomonas sp.]
MKEKIINIQRDFSRYPAGRYRSDGPYNGERFRDDFLIPALNNKADNIRIELDGVRGYNSSFLDEAFGGLVNCGFPVKELLERLQFISQDKSLIEEIKGYIKDRVSIAIQTT